MSWPLQSTDLNIIEDHWDLVGWEIINMEYHFSDKSDKNCVMPKFLWNLFGTVSILCNRKFGRFWRQIQPGLELESKLNMNGQIIFLMLKKQVQFKKTKMLA